MEGEQFSLCWNNFHSNLSSGFQNLYKEEDLVDVTLAAEGKFIKAHKTVLSICSPYFKELFRVNPCKHPIVILQDVNFNALCSLLQFMYEGQVSVSQEEIPTFMKVAETLKIKGLTDNGNPKFDSNGLTSTDQKNPLKKPMRPIKKPVKQPFRSTGSPGVQRNIKPTIPQPPSKKMHLEPTLLEPLIRPKLEPMDDESVQSFNEEQFETSINPATLLATPSTSMLENSSNSTIEASPVGGGGWGMDNNYKPPDTSTPGTIQCILGKRGNPRLIVDGHVFYKKSTYKGKAFWYCKNSRTTDKCQAVCWTQNGNIVKWPYMHTHAVIPDVFNPEEDTEVPIENLQEVLWQTSI